MASDNVNGIFQDSKGFYWLGTESGLQKFDGKNFSDIQPGKAYKNGRVTAGTVFGLILEDKQQNIWIQTANAISVYHHVTGKVADIKIKDDAKNTGVILQISVSVEMEREQDIYRDFIFRAEDNISRLEYCF